MKRSLFFLPTLKETPREAQIVSHQLMLRGGFIYQTASGIYSWLPLGTMVLKNIEKIIEEEQNAIGCQRIIMPTVQPAELWKESGRYDDYGQEMLRIQDRHEREMLYGPTHEEVFTDISRHFLHSYKQLPTSLYQIHWKFRDEIRPRFGVMRGREFLMKDGYSIDVTKEGAYKTYENIFNSYIKIFDRIFSDIKDPFDQQKNIRAIPVAAESGAIGGPLSHEFQIVAKTGESQIFYDIAHEEIENRNYETLRGIYSAADEKHCPEKCSVKPECLRTSRGIELGHTFYFGDKYSRAMNFSVADSNGGTIYPEMGSYGIGVSRMVGAIIETSHDEAGIIWPKSVSPFLVGLINLMNKNSEGEEIYQKFKASGVSVLFDDRTDVSAGVKFSEMDLIGLPFQIIVGKKFLETGLLEIKERRSGNILNLNVESCLNYLLQV